MSDRAERVYGMRFHGGPVKGLLSHPKGHEKSGQNKNTKRNDELAKEIAKDIPRVWDAIGYDWMELTEGSTITSEELVEATTDANRLHSFGFPESEKAFRTLIDDIGYPAAAKLIASKLPFKLWGS